MEQNIKQHSHMKGASQQFLKFEPGTVVTTPSQFASDQHAPQQCSYSTDQQTHHVYQVNRIIPKSEMFDYTYQTTEQPSLVSSRGTPQLNHDIGNAGRVMLNANSKKGFIANTQASEKRVLEPKQVHPHHERYFSLMGDNTPVAQLATNNSGHARFNCGVRTNFSGLVANQQDRSSNSVVVNSSDSTFRESHLVQASSNPSQYRGVAKEITTRQQMPNMREEQVQQAAAVTPRQANTNSQKNSEQCHSKRSMPYMPNQQQPFKFSANDASCKTTRNAANTISYDALPSKAHEQFHVKSTSRDDACNRNSVVAPQWQSAVQMHSHRQQQPASMQPAYSVDNFHSMHHHQQLQRVPDSRQSAGWTHVGQQKRSHNRLNSAKSAEYILPRPSNCTQTTLNSAKNAADRHQETTLAQAPTNLQVQTEASQHFSQAQLNSSNLYPQQQQQHRHQQLVTFTNTLASSLQPEEFTTISTARKQQRQAIQNPGSGKKNGQDQSTEGHVQKLKAHGAKKRKKKEGIAKKEKNKLCGNNLHESKNQLQNFQLQPKHSQMNHKSNPRRSPSRNIQTCSSLVPYNNKAESQFQCKLTTAAESQQQSSELIQRELQPYQLQSSAIDRIREPERLGDGPKFESCQIAPNRPESQKLVKGSHKMNNELLANQHVSGYLVQSSRVSRLEKPLSRCNPSVQPDFYRNVNQDRQQSSASPKAPNRSQSLRSHRKSRQNTGGGSLSGTADQSFSIREYSANKDRIRQRLQSEIERSARATLKGQTSNNDNYCKSNTNLLSSYEAGSAFNRDFSAGISAGGSSLGCHHTRNQTSQILRPSNQLRTARGVSNTSLQPQTPTSFRFQQQPVSSSFYSLQPVCNRSTPGTLAEKLSANQQQQPPTTENLESQYGRGLLQQRKQNNRNEFQAQVQYGCTDLKSRNLETGIDTAAAPLDNGIAAQITFSKINDQQTNRQTDWQNCRSNLMRGPPTSIEARHIPGFVDYRSQPLSQQLASEVRDQLSRENVQNNMQQMFPADRNVHTRGNSLKPMEMVQESQRKSIEPTGTSLSPLYKIATEAEPSPLKEHKKVIQNFLQTYKIHRSQTSKDATSQFNQKPKVPQHKRHESRHEKQLFERLEHELTSIVQVFQRERQLMKQENAQLRQMLQERDNLMAQIQSDFHNDKERMLNSWRLEKNLQEQSVHQLREDMQRLANDFERMSEKLSLRETEIDKLRQERLTMREKLAEFDSKKEEWRKQTMRLEDYFNEQLEEIRNGFDLQLRGLIENQKLETEILEQALQEKQQKLDDQSKELLALQTKRDFVALNAEVLQKSDETESQQNQLASFKDAKAFTNDELIQRDKKQKQEKSPVTQRPDEPNEKNFESVTEMHAVDENLNMYQDTIQRLKLRVSQLQERLAQEERRESRVDDSDNVGLCNSVNELNLLDNSGTLHVQNKINSMRLNFELLEKRLGQKPQQIQLPESGRVYVVTGRQSDKLPSNANILSQGSLTGRGTQGQANNRSSLAGADRSAGQDSLETVFAKSTDLSQAMISSTHQHLHLAAQTGRDIRARTTAADGAHSTSVMIEVLTPRLNSNQQSARLNQTQNESGSREKQEKNDNEMT